LSSGIVAFSFFLSGSFRDWWLEWRTEWDRCLDRDMEQGQIASGIERESVLAEELAWGVVTGQSTAGDIGASEWALLHAVAEAIELAGFAMYLRHHDQPSRC